MKQIYLDNAATTQMRPEALEAMMPHLTEAYGNASSIYPLGEEAAATLAEARRTVAQAINADDREVHFTSGGSESDNWALIATAEAYESKGRHIVTSAIEHHAILHTAEYLEKRGFEVTYVPVDENGTVSSAALEAAMRPDTILVSIMFANNEIAPSSPSPSLQRSPTTTARSSIPMRFRRSGICPSTSRKWASTCCRLRPTRSTGRRARGSST